MKSTSLPGFSWWLESMKRMSPGPKRRKGGDALDGRAHPFDGQGFDRRSRLRVDRRDARIELAVGDGARHEARRVAAANLDDAPRPCRAHHRVGGSGVEARKPVLVPARGGRGLRRQSLPDRLRTPQSRLRTRPSLATTDPGICRSTSSAMPSSMSSSCSGSWWNTHRRFAPASRHRRTPLPRRVSPPGVGLVLGIGVHAVVDHEIGARDQFEDVAVRRAGNMLGVGEVAQRAAGVIDAIAGRAVRMVERGGAHGDVRRRLERLAGPELAVLHACGIPAAAPEKAATS